MWTAVVGSVTVLMLTAPAVITEVEPSTPPSVTARAAGTVVTTPLRPAAPRYAGMENGTFSEFSGTNATNGTFTNVIERAYEGSRSARATYNGSSGNGFSRGYFHDLVWSEGTDVWYGAAFYLPAGFKTANKNVVDLMRWDNWTIDPEHTDHGGLMLWKDGKLRFFKEQSGVQPYTVMLGPWDVPEGRWVWLEVHQRFSSVNGKALTEVYVDGAQVGRTTAANFYGRPIPTIRYGLVAVDAARQTNALSLWFDRATVSSSRVGP